MTEFLWYWENGSVRFYTRKREVAEEAMRRGLLIFGKRVKSRIFSGRK